MEPIVYGLSNEQYHRGEEERQYLSSSQLKWYLKSPRHAKFMLDALTYGDAKTVQNCKAVADFIEGKSDALRFGSLFHDLMESLAIANGDWGKGYGRWKDGIAIFDPPINSKTNTYYGATTKAYKESYEYSLADNQGKTVAGVLELDLAGDMACSLIRDSGATSEQVRKLLKWGKPEVSFFYETEDGIKLKVRPDLLTRKKIIDWKTTTSDDLTEDAINRIILKYGYHISAAMYQYVVHEITGVWRDFILVIVSKVAPHDCVMVDMSHGIRDPYTGQITCYGYYYDRESDIVEMGCGAMEFKNLLDLHIKCTKENHWPGAEQAIPDNNGVRILEIQPPRYYANRFIEEI